MNQYSTSTDLPWGASDAPNTTREAEFTSHAFRRSVQAFEYLTILGLFLQLFFFVVDLWVYDHFDHAATLQVPWRVAFFLCLIVGLILSRLPRSPAARLRVWEVTLVALASTNWIRYSSNPALVSIWMMFTPLYYALAQVALVGPKRRAVVTALVFFCSTGVFIMLESVDGFASHVQLMTINMLFLAGLFFLVGHLVYVLLRKDFVRNRLLQTFNTRLQGELAKERRNVIDVLGRLETEKDQQRVHLARELHDHFGHILTAMKTDLLVIARGQMTDNDREILARIDGQVDALDRDTHLILEGLRSDIVTASTCEETLRLLVKGLSERTGVSADYLFEPEDMILKEEFIPHLVGIVREALANTERHAQATAVEVVVTNEYETLVVLVRDNGQGFNPDRNADLRRGIVGMNERVSLFNGSMTIQSKPSEGTTIEITFPAVNVLDMEK